MAGEQILTKKVSITKIAAVAGLGSSIDNLWTSLCNSESAVQPVKRFSTDRLMFHNGVCIDELDYGSKKNQTIILVRQVLDQIAPVPAGTFIIWAGAKSNAEYIERTSQGLDAESYYLPAHYRIWISDYLGLRPNGMEINSACASSATAIAIGAQMISLGKCSSVLVCAADLVTRFTFMGFAALRALSKSVCRPFDKNRDGLVLGDGCAALLLADDETVSRFNLEELGQVTGWSITNDANHITGPARDGCGLTFAIKSALKHSGLSENEIEAYCAHGTGTVYNDAMELIAIKEIFGERRFPIFSVKGAIGHTLGAAGVIEAALSVKALQEKKVPATSALREPESRGYGCISENSQEFPGKTILTTNSGFGGVNCAIIIEAS